MSLAFRSEGGMILPKISCEICHYQNEHALHSKFLSSSFSDLEPTMTVGDASAGS